MSEHLSESMLSALADGELAGEEMARVEVHLAECAECTRRALSVSLLKRAVARAGQRYEMPEGLRERVMGAVASTHPSGAWMGHPDLKYGDSGRAPGAVQNDGGGRVAAKKAWIVAVAAAVLVCVSAFVARDVSLRGAQQAALVSEAVDEHIAAIAAAGPEVVSSDRHTVKPWFQGKLPFSFNLPEHLPSDATLDGANLVQVEGHAAAQLLFSIGKHRASVFVRQDNGDFNAPMHLFYRMHALFPPLQAEHNGFRVEGFVTRGGLEFDAVSDADPARLGELVRAIEQAQE